MNGGRKEAKKGPPRVDKGEKVEGGDIDFSSPAKGKNFEYKREMEGNYLSAYSVNRLYLDTEDTRKV